jgi:hypothetical protein
LQKLEAASPKEMTIDDLLAAIADPKPDRRKLARGLWNREKSEPHLHRVGTGRYIWKDPISAG